MDEEMRKKIKEAAEKKIEELTKAKLEEISAVTGVVPGVGAVRPVGIGSYVTAAYGPAPYSLDNIPRPQRPYIMTVELLEDGMVLRYSYPVKKTVTIPARSGFDLGTNPAIKLFFEGIAEAIDGGGEDWQEEGRKSRFAKTFEKINALSAPRKVEQYFFETRSSVCKNATEIENATKSAREAAKLIKELEEKGEVIRHGHGHPGYPMSPFVAQAPAEYVTGEDVDLSLGA